MSDAKTTFEAVDSSIADHIKAAVGDNLMVVGWVVSVATKEIGNENFDANGFAHFTSESFPEYSQIGLLQTVMDDKRNTEVVAGVAGTIINAIHLMSNNGDE